MYLLDTNVVSELRKARSGKADARVVQWAEARPPSWLFLSAVTVLELETGVLQIERRDADQGSACANGWNDRCSRRLPAASCPSTPKSPAAARACMCRTVAPSGMH